MATIDADTHVIESEQTWDYLTASDRRHMPIAVAPKVEADGPRESWIVDGRAVGKGGAMPIGDMTAGMRELNDVDSRLKHMDELGVDIQVVYPTFFLHPVTKRPEIESALCGAYNRFMGDVWSQGKTRLRWAIVPPLTIMEDALKELEFGKKNGACAVFVRGLEGDRFLTDPYFYPLYEKAQDLDLAITLHAGTGNHAINDIWSRDPFFGLVMPVLAGFQGLIVSDVPDKFPKLRFGFLEAGAGWVPFLIQEARRREEWWKGGKLPANLVEDRRFYIALRTDDDLPQVLAATGEDHLVIGTDYGHTDVAAEIDALRRLRDQGEVEPRIIDKILDDNARALFAL